MRRLAIAVTVIGLSVSLASCDDDDEKTIEYTPIPAMTETGTVGTAVDLGVSVLWASHNVGGAAESDRGNYLAWGETAGKTNYLQGNYAFYDTEKNVVTKYDGKDGLITLEAADDVATAKWGEAWRIPTKAEWQELCDSCKWEWKAAGEYDSEQAGYVVSNKKDAQKKIFLPAAGYCEYDRLNYAGGYGYYWASGIDTTEGDVYCLRFNDSYQTVYSTSRYMGVSVRAVSAK